MKYNDIINLEHFHLNGKPYMSVHDRAAQFMPFKSLNPYHGKVRKKENDILGEEWRHVEYDEDYLDF